MFRRVVALPLIVGLAVVVGCTAAPTPVTTTTTVPQPTTTTTTAPPVEFFGTKDLGDKPQFGVSDGTYLWFSAPAEDALLKVRPFDGEVIARFEGGPGKWDEPTGIEFDGTNIWVASFQSDEVVKVDPNTGEVLAAFPANGPWGLEFDGTNIWASNLIDPYVATPGSVVKINTKTNSLVGSYQVGLAIRHLHFDGSTLWVSSGADYYVHKVNPVNGQVTGSVNVGPSPAGITSDSTFVYVTVLSGDTIAKIRKSTSAVVDLFPIPGNPIAVTVAGPGLWVVSHQNPVTNTIGQLHKVRFDGLIEETYQLGVAPWDVLAVNGSVWATSTNSRTLFKLDLG